MISYRQADLLDQYNQPSGKLNLNFTIGSDDYADGHTKYSVRTDSGIDFSHCNVHFKMEIMQILKDCGFEFWSDHTWMVVFPWEQVSERNYEQAFRNKMDELERHLTSHKFAYSDIQDQNLVSLEITK